MSESSVTEDELIQRLGQFSANGVHHVAIADGLIPIQVEQRHSSALLVIFAGAIDREKRTLPKFGGDLFRRFSSASVIGVADPSLTRANTLRTAWYAGHEGFETQQILPGLLQRLAAACGAERIILIGSSAAGFAALYYSWRLPGSVAIVANPQTNIERYYTSHVTGYRDACRPSLAPDASLATVITSNVAPGYGKRFDNSVVYLQSASDAYHVRNHLVPFLAAIPFDYRKRLLPRMDHWGRDGHQPPPRETWWAWVNAAIDAPSSAADEIQLAYQAATGQRSQPIDVDAATHDYRLSEIIAEQARHSQPSTDPAETAHATNERGAS